MTESDLFLKYGISLAIGILMGMQRESATRPDGPEQSAGVRTFALIGLWGCLAAHISDISGSALPLAACLAILGSFLTAMYFVETKDGKRGLTTEVASLVAFLAGVLAFHDRLALAGALGVVATLLLSLKVELHMFARKLTREDIFATLKFAILGVVFLPILPDRAYFREPFDVLNPFEIGLFIVLMSAVGFIGYILAKTLGSARGIGLMGLLGGLVSSTALTLGFTQRSRSDKELSGPLAMAIIASWTVMFARTLAVVATLDFDVGLIVWLPLTAAMATGLLYCSFLFRLHGTNEETEKTPFSNPFELGPALKFGLLFIVILTASRVAQYYFGNMGIFLSSFGAGLMDVDAVSFSMTRMSDAGKLDASSAAKAVLLAAMANSLLKGGFAMMAGSRELRKAIFPGFVLMAIAGSVAAWFAR